MSDETDSGGKPITVGGKVFVKDKNLEGVVKFVGTTHFAPGKWIGIHLAEPKGKNNGSVQGKSYFTCPDSCGLFVRQNQVLMIDHIPETIQSFTPKPESKIPTPSVGKHSRGSPSQLRKSNMAAGDATTSGGKLQPQSKSQPTLATKEPIKEVLLAEEEAPVAASGDEAARVKDLEEKLTILQRKRAEDKAKIKDLERAKLQLQQMTEYKQRWVESQAELQQQLKAARKEAKEAVEAKDKVEEELRDLSDAVEMATLDKEMAEERCESLNSECEALKEKVEELTIDLEILKNEISESGLEGAVAGYQTKQLEQQNHRLKEALMRLRDISQQDKNELQHTAKELEKLTTELTTAQQRNESLKEELAKAEDTIDELKEQVDDALGAEEMVEKLTDKNLQLEERIETLEETVSDLEALRDIAEEQEELRVEVEHDMREELDMQLNKTRETERKVDAAQEIIVDLQQTIEKFRELVKNQQATIEELQQKGATRQQHELDTHSHAVLTLNRQLKSTSMKAHSRTIEFELRKLEAQQSMEHIELLKSFMPNSFLTSGGDYDAILSLMLLPRLLFKADLILSQLKQQYKLEDRLTVANVNEGEKLAFVTHLVSKLCYLIRLVSRVQRILNRCEVTLYQQMGGHRDELSLHERSLDVLVGLLKEEILDETVSLAGLEKAINYFEGLLEIHLVGQPFSSAELLTDYLRLFQANTDAAVVKMLQVKLLIPEGCTFATQLKELESRCADIAQICRRIKRKIPAADNKQNFQFTSEVVGSLQQCSKVFYVIQDAVQKLQLLTSQKGNSLSDGELLPSGVVEELYREVSAQTIRNLPTPPTDGSQDGVRSAMSLIMSTLNGIASAIQDGEYDSNTPREALPAPCVSRAAAVKAELSDTEGLRFKLDEKNHDIVELKKTVKIKVQELSEAAVKIGLLEKRVDNAGTEVQSKLKEKEDRIQELENCMQKQEEKFEKAMDVLQGDIDALEQEKVQLTKKLDLLSKKAIHAGIMGSRYTSSETVAAFMSGMSGHSGSGREAMSSPSHGGGKGTIILKDSPQLTTKVDSLNKCLQYSHEENMALKAKIARAQLASLPKLSLRCRPFYHEVDSELTQFQKEVETIQKDCVEFNAVRNIVDITQPSVPTEQQLENQLQKKISLKLRKAKALEKGKLLLASQLPGGLTNTKVTSFVSPSFSKVLDETGSPELIGRIKVQNKRQQQSSSPSSAKTIPLLMDSRQLWLLHTALVK